MLFSKRRDCHNYTMYLSIFPPGLSLTHETTNTKCSKKEKEENKRKIKMNIYLIFTLKLHKIYSNKKSFAYQI